MLTRRMSWAAAAACLALLIAAAAAGSVVVSEIMADPSVDWDGDGSYDYKSDEWIEVANLGADPVDLGEYWLQDAAANSPRLHLSGMIQPGERAVFYGSDAVAWQAEVGVTTAGFSLNNDGDTVILLHSFEGDGGHDLEIMQEVAYPDHAADDDRSFGLSDDGSTWILYDGLFPYSGTADPPGTGCEPTPAEPNVCGALVPVEDLSFGTLKAQFL